MSLKIVRVAYYIVFSLSALFFAYELAWSFRSGMAPNKSFIMGCVLLVGATVYGIAKTDKQYLIRSMPLRMVGFVSGTVGFVLLMRTFYLS
jgi:undecaprenyl pyrophosphate phosphatase UppP